MNRPAKALPIVFTACLLVPLAARAETLRPLPALLHVHSTLSTGDLPLDRLVASRQEDGLAPQPAEEGRDAPVIVLAPLLVRVMVALGAGQPQAEEHLGDVIDERGRVIAGPRRDSGSFDDTVAVLREGRMWQPPSAEEHNTVLVVVATNAVLTKEQANRLATVCHDGMARAVRPCHTPSDGDTIFVLATGEQAIEHREYRALEVIASLAVERAIRRGVTTATGLGGVPALGELKMRRR